MGKKLRTDALHKMKNFVKNTVNCIGFLFGIRGLQMSVKIAGEGAGKNTSHCRGFLLGMRGLQTAVKIAGEGAGKN